MKKTIRLRRYTSADAKAFREAALESVVDVYPWMPWCHSSLTMEEAQLWVESRERCFREGHEFSFIIADSTGHFLGSCDLNQINPAYRLANLGYWVRSSASGRGVAPAAVSELAKFAFTTTNLIRLEIVCATGNVRSQRVAEKVGAIREAILGDRLLLHGKTHDAVLYAILRSRWNFDD